MALTDTRPASDTESSAVAPALAPSPLTIFGSGDHKAIGTVYVVAALLFGVAGWIVNALVSVHGVGDGSFLSADAFQTMFTLNRLGLVLLVAVPLFLGLATYIVPLQVGASTVAFPRASAAALWGWLLSSGVLIVANCIDGGLDGTRPKAVALGLLALAGLVVSLLLGTVCVVTTAIALRTTGLSLDRVPMFTWATIVGGAVWIVTLPALFAAVLLAWIDQRYGTGTAFGTAAQWKMVAWMASTPQVYAFVIPGLGLALDAVATLTGTRLPLRGVVQFAIGAFGVLSVGVFAQSIFYDGFQDEALWIVMSLAIVVPVLLLLAALATLLKAGRPRLASPTGLSVVGLLLTLLAVIAGALMVFSPLELTKTGVFAAGQYNLVLAAALTLAAAGIMYWAPKITGHLPADGAGKLAVLLFLGGGALAGLPMCVLGFANRFTGLADANDLLMWLTVAGSALLALGGLVILAGLLSGARKGAPEAGSDPWGTGQTLEWACPSPPPTGNFGTLAVVRSAEPLLDEEA